MSKHSPEVALAAAVGAILAAMIVPLPPWLLDLGLAMNLAAAVALLATSLAVRNALELSAFPALLLVTTLFRLALNVSSTRLALAEAHAGEVIHAFGEFVVRGDYLVGAVCFGIVTLVQLLVVAKGAERVAEVSARFTLDAMPGKQMSIDADLRAGGIDHAEASRRRNELEREAKLHGAMDGAMKFVKGDAIAGLVIVAVNLLGGLGAGVLQHGMTATEALATYGLIAIGDGLVSQIPSLAIATAAGLVATRVAGERASTSLGEDIWNQLFRRPSVAYVVAALGAGIGLMPGMPHATFLALSAALGAGAWTMGRRAQPPAAEPMVAAPLVPGVSPLILDLAEDLAVLAAQDEGALQRGELDALRAELFLSLGVRAPPILVRTGGPPLGQYALLVDELPVGVGQLRADQLYAGASPGELQFLSVQAEADLDPETRRACARVGVEAGPVLKRAQISVRSARQVLLGHVRSLLRKHASLLFGVQELQLLLEAFEPSAPALVKEVLRKVPLPLLSQVFKALVEEGVSIRNLRAILEALVAPHAEGDADALAERCRQALHRALSHRHAPTGILFAHLVDPAIEAALRSGGPKGLALDPAQVRAILEAVRALGAGAGTTLLVAPDVRRTLRRLCEGAFPDVAVLTYAELDADLQIRPLGRLGLPLQAA